MILNMPGGQPAHRTDQIRLGAWIAGRVVACQRGVITGTPVPWQCGPGAGGFLAAPLMSP